MRVTSLQMAGFRSFANMDSIELGTINVLIGANNSGKSSILRALSLMQTSEGSPPYPDVRIGHPSASIRIGLTGIDNPTWTGLPAAPLVITLSTEDRRGGSIALNFIQPNGSSSAVSQLPAIEPYHFIVPYLSKRKVMTFQEDVRQQHAMAITQTMTYLAAKLSRLGNPEFPGSEKYRDTCRAILGFVVTAVPSEGGQRPGTYLPTREVLPIEQMGEGVPNIVALLADLALSKDKLFLIEEPENDLHPAALKALLELILESSSTNQFVISTHSNIVVSTLGASPEAKILEVSSVRNRLPTEATVRPVDATPQSRLDVLRSLGYSLSDFDLWDGWLFLEEASAERVIRDYLIPWFTPALTRVRTISANGVSRVEPSFDDFHRLTLFSQLQEVYSRSTWVCVDGDEPGNELVRKLRDKYRSWPADRFRTFSSQQFERYYPSHFHERVDSVLGIQDRQARREAKRVLLDDVRSWLDEDEARGKAALRIDAAEVIEVLREISSKLKPQ
ncbi:ATP-dependent nuclease [Ramlibacter tataouinensis]|uniref:ATPase AAA-type core domain-containing protein n=1 Tax=Ramlibacter tataouinensis (strain ATCC BAA-407 / DSM 14655 / LMG 21543 / TTB310) TaxID=365046 RepID=F5Y126_RAMTT|nr:ATP-binding protein [Ramlibacter tataouinensis]AEG92244.1 Hypothetical protein Rta_11585 [Ramlibacter tataouinensis TTB310]